MTWGQEGVDTSACRAQIPGPAGPTLSEYQAPRHPHSPASQGPQGILSSPLQTGIMAGPTSELPEVTWGVCTAGLGATLWDKSSVPLS